MSQIPKLFAKIRRKFAPKSCFDNTPLDSAPEANSPLEVDFKPESYRDSFLELPIDLILMITDYLDEEYRALLSLTCKNLRAALCKRFDLSLSDPAIKQRFLRYLEKDYPTLLPCHRCGLMFKWKTREPQGYACRCERILGAIDPLTLGLKYPIMNIAMHMRREVVDLLVRAHERGKEYGLSLAILNQSHAKIIPFGLRFEKTTSRAFVEEGGRLLVLYRREFASSEGSLHTELNRLKSSAFCKHYWLNQTHGLWPSLEDVVERTPSSELSVTDYQCHYCATDITFCFKDTQVGFFMVIKCRADFGGRYDRDRACDQIFDEAPPQLDAGEVARRNLYALFEASNVRLP